MNLPLTKKEVISEHWTQYYYICPCGKGTIVKADFNYGFESSDCWILCPECKRRYKRIRTGNVTRVVPFDNDSPIVFNSSIENQKEILLPSVLYSTQDGTISFEPLRGSA